MGGLSAYLARVVSSGEYLGLRSLASKVAKKMHRRLHSSLGKAEEFTRGMVTGGTLFEELGFYYVGPIDGHNLDHLVPVLENIRDSDQGPVLIHVVTEKGKGYKFAEESADKYHGVSKFDVITGEQKKSKGGPPNYQNVFGETLAKLAETDDKIVAITAAMPSGTGVDKFAKAHPERSFDVGIAALERDLSAQGKEVAPLWDRSGSWPDYGALVSDWEERLIAQMRASLHGVGQFVEIETVILSSYAPESICQDICRKLEAAAPQIKAIAGNIVPAPKAIGAASLPFSSRFMVSGN